jgi:hypothetical protein
MAGLYAEPSNRAGPTPQSVEEKAMDAGNMNGRSTEEYRFISPNQSAHCDYSAFRRMTHQRELVHPPGGVHSMAFETPGLPRIWSLDKHGSHHRSAYRSTCPQNRFSHRYGVPTGYSSCLRMLRTERRNAFA